MHFNHLHILLLSQAVTYLYAGVTQMCYHYTPSNLTESRMVLVLRETNHSADVTVLTVYILMEILFSVTKESPPKMIQALTPTENCCIDRELLHCGG